MPKELILGIDDAGRGPLIGPMILAGVIIEKEDEENLKKEGIKDSKLIINKTREQIAKNIIKKFPHHVETTPPKEIDSNITNGTNLNTIEAIKSASIINNLLKDKTIKRIKIIIDCPSPNTTSWKNQVLDNIHKENHKKIELLCEHKADLNHISCGAASIIAKYYREEAIKQIKKELNIDCGSGYPSDPLTKSFLEENINNFPNKGIFRKTWKTFTNAKANSEQKELF